MPNLLANWPAPFNVHALTAAKLFFEEKEGQNHLGFASENNNLLTPHRIALAKSLNLSHQPAWLKQTHSTECVIIEKNSSRDADAAITRQPLYPLAVVTADCLPILLCNLKGTEIAAIHAGWRGLVNGIIEKTLAKMESPLAQLMAWIGPAICHKCFEVGEEVRETYIQNYPFSVELFSKNNLKWLANLPLLGEKILKNAGVNFIYQSNACTFERTKEFYSYRRDKQIGRMASLIWFNATT